MQNLRPSHLQKPSHQLPVGVQRMGNTALQDVNPESSMQIVWVSEWLCNASYVAGSPGDIRTQRSMGPTAAGPAFLFWVGLSVGWFLVILLILLSVSDQHCCPRNNPGVGEDGSTAKSTDCSSGASGFDSQDPQSGSQGSGTRALF